MPFPHLLVHQFMRLTLSRNFAEAERVLDKIKHAVSASDWSKGYCHALDGMLTAYRTRDERYTVINRLEPDREKIKQLEETYYGKSRNLIEANFDRGFFAAWADLARLLQKDDSLLKTTPSPEKKEEENHSSP
ncbi:MAG: hypothetical protein ACE5PO_05720 [Candidatus Bathyarchaeia archaeon]